MEIFEHFGHKQHPLAFRDEDENEEQKAYSCSICDLPMLSSPSYTCTSKDCKFVVHKACAQLPYKLNHPHDPRGHAFSLERYPRGGGPQPCQLCHKLCRNFTYTCYPCEFDLHPLCARPVEIKSQHESHNEHPLVAICRETLSLCNACGEEHYGFFFFCQECNFWIHRDCALLPHNMKTVAHPHPLILTYALSDLYDRTDCGICGKKLFGKGIYSCGQCLYVAHVNCAKSNMENLTSGQELIHLPDEGTTFPSLIIRILENKRTRKDIMDNKNKLTIEEYHNHLLIFHDGTKHENQNSSSREECLVQESVCNACIQPLDISSPFWGCSQPDCHFLLHNLCMENIPYSIQSGLFKQPLVIGPGTSNDFFCSVFPCHFCLRPFNGFSYHLNSGTSDLFQIDLECASAPNTIKHGSHRQHVLFIAGLPFKPMPFSCCSDKNWYPLVYRCASCDFMIHLGCALLPKMVNHKFDKHPLELVFTDWVKQDVCFCEFCEQDIDQRYWFYHCAKCDQSFHVKCISSVGFLSKVKFGGTLNVSCHRRHPVALTRMLVVGNQRCGYCEKIIEGFVDEMAFYCSECEFWIHFGCAWDCSVDSESRRPGLWYEFLKTVM